LNMASAANVDGDFLSLYGLEYGVASDYNGHVVIYGFNQVVGWESSVPGVIGNNYDVYNDKSDYDALFKKVKNQPGAFCYLAHPNFTDFSKDGTDPGALANAPYNVDYDSAIVGMPLRSGLALSAIYDYSGYTSYNYLTYYKRMLYQGYHLGIGYDHDNHYTNFGRGNGGRLAIIAHSLTRSNLFRAMKLRNFYGSDDSNARAEFTLGDKIMGSIVKGTDFPTFKITHADPDGEDADTIKIWKGYRNSGGLWAQIVFTNNQKNSALYTDYDIKENIEYYYFAEIRQKDGQWMVTSPIWYTSTVPLAVSDKMTQPRFHFFPNPVSGRLNISMEEACEYRCEILDVCGRSVFAGDFFGRETDIDVALLNKGIYSLRISSATGNSVSRLVIE
jgi:hypothetical protein